MSRVFRQKILVAQRVKKFLSLKLDFHYEITSEIVSSNLLLL